VTENIIQLQAGNYTVTATDATGCTVTAAATVSQPDAIQIITSVNDVTCYNANNGSIQTNTSGGVSPYTYLWSNTSTNADLTGVTAGNYDLTVTDNNQCTASIAAVVNQPQPITISAVTTNISCFGLTDGAIQLLVSGGTPAY